MPLGKGYTVEGQVTGAEVRLPPFLRTSYSDTILKDIGGIQIDVFPMYHTGVRFKHNGSDLNIYKTARQLGIRAGVSIQMTPLVTTIASQS
jgi:hypothetical protein